MRAIHLTIAGLPVDLPAATKGLVRLTQARAALAELSSRFGEFSWPITLPDTRNNARIFGVGALHPLGLDKFRTLDYSFELRCEGEIFTGNFRLTSLRSGYTGNLIGAGAAWSSEIGDKMLTDLKLAPVDYDGTQLEAILAKDCDASDIQFPLLSFGNFFAPPTSVTKNDGTKEDQSLPAQALIDYPLSVDDYLPSVYFRNVLRQMFKDIGWTLTGRVLDEARWRETVIAPAGATVAEAWPWPALLPSAGTGGAQTVYCYVGGYYNGQGNSYANNAAGFDEAEDIIFLPLAVPSITQQATRALDGGSGAYTAPVEGVYRFNWAATLAAYDQKISDQGGSNGAGVPLMVPICVGLIAQRGGETFAGADGGLLTRGAFDADQQRVYAPARVDELRPGQYNGVTGDVYLAAGDTLRLCLFTRRSWRPELGSEDGIWRERFSVLFSSVAFACTYYADLAGVSARQLKPALFLPKLSQRDVLRDFIARTDAVAVADANRRTVTLLTRDELSLAAGTPIDLTGLIDPALIEYTPAAGVGVGAVVFASAANTGEPLPAGLLDTVRIVVGPGTGEQRVDSLFAPVALRSYAVRRPFGGTLRADIPTLSSAEGLAQPLAEVAWDVSSQAPRLLHFLGPDAAVTIPFQGRRVPLARAEWAGPLRFDTVSGAVASYYGRTVERLTRGHVAKAPANLTPALYRQLTPGRAVRIQAAEYHVETLSQFDIADEANTTTIELIREL